VDNAYVTQHFDWDRPPSRRARLVNAVLARLGVESRLVAPFSTGEMTTVEQRLNMFHLLGGVLTFGVPGDVVELGSHGGSSAALFQLVLDQFDPARRLHVYDAFVRPPADVLLSNFRELGLRTPEVHAGWFSDTLPGQLPERVCFAHIDLGPGRSPAALEDDVRLCLEAVYPRLSPGAVVLLADYCEPDVYDRPGYHFPRAVLSRRQWHLYPQVKRACDAFLAGKPEQVFALYGGAYSHGFFRKR
jgi:O-methyltransferase